MEELFGTYFAQLRRGKLGLSLRKFCQEHGYDPGNISKLERGKLSPPQSREKIREYAEALGLAEDSDEWIEFFDRAAAARGDIPREILDNADIAEKLPVLFRTLRGDRVPDEDLDRLVEIITKT